MQKLANTIKANNMQKYLAEGLDKKKLAEMAVQAELIINAGLKHGLVGGTRNERRIAKKLAKKVKR